MPEQSETPARVLGIRIDRLTCDALIESVSDMVASGTRRKVAYANIHVLNVAWSDPDLRQILNDTDLVYCDGYGVLLGARLLGYRLPDRMTGADWIYPFCERSASTGISIYLLGSAQGVAERAADRLLELYPSLRIVGTHHGYLHDTPEASAAAIADVNAVHPDILLVGMGTPLQEKWIAAHRSELNVPVCWSVGALFDYVAGMVPRGPRWMLDNGLEWLYRLYLEPRRLGYRYLVGNPLFFWRVLKQRMAGKRRRTV